MNQRKYDLEDRLVDFAIRISELVEKATKTKLGNHLGSQIIRSSTAPALIYGEVQSSESQKDFIHKMKILLKELRETRVCLKILLKKQIIPREQGVQSYDENEELIAIFAKSIKTAESKKA